MEWDKPETWKALVDEIVPMFEVLIVFGVQYVASTLEAGTMKAINSLRCMFNNFGSNGWTFAAGTW